MAEIKNVVDNTNLTGHDGVTNNQVTNWISQVNAGGTVYDIATHHGITFKDGSTDTTGVMWNGLTDIEIVIPSITDIVQTPIEFVGTVNADGKVMDGTKEIVTFEKGNLVFIAADCTFDGKVCEAGDMAIYDGSEWKVVTGENQVSIVGNNGEAETTIAIGPAKQVLTVEGKTLTLSLDYADLNKHLGKTRGVVTDITFDTMTVDSVGIKLIKGDDVATSIGVEQTITYGTELANGTVNLTGATGLVNGITWGTLNPGTETTSKGNTEKNLAVSGGRLTPTINQSTGDFVNTVSINPVTFAPADDNEAGSIKVITGITAGEGSEFLNGIHVTREKESVDFTTPGYISPEGGVNAKYIKGLKNAAKPIIGVKTAGSFSIAGGIKDIVTGWGTESSTTGEVVSSVSVSAKNDTSVLKTAKVENHVLSFDPVNVASDVTTTCSYKSLSKAAYTYTPTALQEGEFDMAGFTEVDGVKYTFDRGKETVYTESPENWKLTTPALTVQYGSYDIDHKSMVANVPANTFIASVTAGQLPSLSESKFSTTDITGTVGTALTTATLEFNALKSNSINMPGAYSLETVDKDGDITVGKHGALAANEATVDLTEYLKEVTIA
jgi:hypothetical protein